MHLKRGFRFFNLFEYGNLFELEQVKAEDADGHHHLKKRKVIIREGESKRRELLVSRISGRQGTLIGRAVVIRCSATGKVDLVNSDRDSSGSRAPVLERYRQYSYSAGAIPNPSFYLSKQCARNWPLPLTSWSLSEFGS